MTGESNVEILVLPRQFSSERVKDCFLLPPKHAEKQGFFSSIFPFSKIGGIKVLKVL
jgi:hypothetical protein